jgi:hypothetical protein
VSGRILSVAATTLAFALPATGTAYSRMDALTHLKSTLKGPRLAYALKMFDSGPFADDGMNMEFAFSATNMHFMAKAKREQIQGTIMLLGEPSAADTCVSNASPADAARAKRAGLSLRRACRAVVRGTLAG